MTKFRNFEDLQIWHEARGLVRAVRKICKRECMKRDFSLIDQITRSARSISTNIAEGCDAMTVPEFINFLGYSKRSASETRSHLYVMLDEAYISKDEMLQLSEHCQRLGKMIAKLIHHLQSIDQDKKRTFKVPINQSTNQPITPIR